MSGFSYYAHSTHPDPSLEPPAPEQPAPPPPRWRKPLVLAVEATVVIALGIGIYFLVNHPVTPDLLASPQCVAGHYRLTWQDSVGTRFAEANLRSPEVDQAMFEFNDNSVTLELPGTSKGDVVAEVRTVDGDQLIAASTASLTGKCA